MNLNSRSTGPWQHTIDIDVARRGSGAAPRGRRASHPAPREPARGSARVACRSTSCASISPSTSSKSSSRRSFPKSRARPSTEARLNPVVPPLVRNLRFAPGAPLQFEAVVDVKPEVEVRVTRGSRATKRSRPVDDGAVERVLERPSPGVGGVRRPRSPCRARRRRAARFHAPRRQRASPAGDPRQGAPHRARRARAAARSRERIAGALSAGRSGTIDVEYPADYGVGDLAGKKFATSSTSRKIQEKKLRSLDDNFAKEVFQLASLDELRLACAPEPRGRGVVRTQREIENTISAELLKRNPVEPAGTPRSLDAGPRRPRGRRGARVTETHFAPSSRTVTGPDVERSLQREVLLAAVARQEEARGDGRRGDPGDPSHGAGRSAPGRPGAGALPK